MSTSVVVSQIAFSDDGATLHAKGTVGGTAFQASFRNNLAALNAQIQNGTPSAVAAALLAKYNSFTAAEAILASNTFSYQPLSLMTAVSIAYGSTPVAQAGYDTLEVTATVAGTSTIAHVAMDDFLEWAGAGTLAAQMSRLLFLQAQSNTVLASGIATFSL